MLDVGFLLGRGFIKYTLSHNEKLTMNARRHEMMQKLNDRNASR